MHIKQLTLTAKLPKELRHKYKKIMIILNTLIFNCIRYVKLNFNLPIYVQQFLYFERLFYGIEPFGGSVKSIQFVYSISCTYRTLNYFHDHIFVLF